MFRATNIKKVPIYFIESNAKVRDNLFMDGENQRFEKNKGIHGRPGGKNV
jgi:hypothetical protein